MVRLVHMVQSFPSAHGAAEAWPRCCWHAARLRGSIRNGGHGVDGTHEQDLTQTPHAREPRTVENRTRGHGTAPGPVRADCVLLTISGA